MEIIDMKSKGIRIFDKINSVVCVELKDILNEIHQGDKYYWSILYFDAKGNLGGNISIRDFEDQINDSKNGLLISWDELKDLSAKLWEIYDIDLIASKFKENISRYKREQVKYETCDFVIRMCDSSFWDIFSRDPKFIIRLASNFKEIEWLETDYHNEYEDNIISKGLRIRDGDENNNIIVELPGILDEINDGETLHWSILFLRGIGNLGLDISNGDFESKIFHLEKGLFFTWKELNDLAKKFDQIEWITLIGCKDEKFIKRYEYDQDMYENCDIVIVMFDGCYWEIFTKDNDLYERFKGKFKIGKYLETDFQKEK